MTQLRTTLVKNSLANLVRLFASALVALVLPHFLTRALDHDRFAAWALMLQVAAYVNYLDLGLQTAVARYFAQALERGDAEYGNKVVNTAFLLLSASAAVALLAICCVLFSLPHLLHRAPGPLLQELRGAILILAVLTALLLPLSTFTGVLIGHCRNDVPAISIAVSRLLGAVLVVFAVSHTQSLPVLATVIGGCNLAGGVAQYFMARKLLPMMRIASSLTSRKMSAELARYCSTLTVWSLCMLLVGGLDVTIVGHYDFAAVGSYSIATMLIAFLTGINNSVYGALLAPLAILNERGQLRHIGSLVIAVTRITTFIDISAVLAVYLIGDPLLRLWVGPAYATQALPILKILVIANAIRLVGAPLSAALVATNQQHYGLSGAIVEGISNFALSIGGAMFIGAIGVAYGTLAGSCISILWVLLLMIRWLKTPIASRDGLILNGCIRPALCLLPMILFVAVCNGLPWTVWRSLGVIVTVFATLGITWRWGQMRQSISHSTA